ncbi:MAG: alpha/beta fold hydrolase [Solirubrobacterales bacterium]|nr:alpha/beta fold hydrolase [Solirubrobacterales bacterium]
MHTELPYEERGSGEPVPLVPGTAFGPASWGEFGELLARRRRAIAYGRRGFSGAAPEEAEDMRVHAEDARSILERAQALPAEVVGWSGGGLAALALAVENPTAVRSLLLIEPSVHGMWAITASAIWMTIRAQLAKLRVAVSAPPPTSPTAGPSPMTASGRALGMRCRRSGATVCSTTPLPSRRSSPTR